MLHYEIGLSDADKDYMMCLYQGKGLGKKIKQDKILKDVPDPDKVAFAALFWINDADNDEDVEASFYVFDKEVKLIEELKEEHKKKFNIKRINWLEYKYDCLLKFNVGNQTMDSKVAEKIINFVIDSETDGKDYLKGPLLDVFQEKGYVKKKHHIL
ncbi:hypothetical protein ACFLQI_00735 [Candidatus Undinarchaeota archaeon]